MKKLQLTSIKKFADKTNGIEYKEIANNPSRLEVKVSVKGTNKHITIVKRAEVNSNKLIVSYYVDNMFYRTLTHITTQKRTIQFIEHLLSEIVDVQTEQPAEKPAEQPNNNKIVYGKKIDKFILECKNNGVKVTFNKWDEDEDFTYLVDVENINDSELVIIKTEKHGLIRITKDGNGKLFVSMRGRIIKDFKTQDGLIEFINNHL